MPAFCPKCGDHVEAELCEKCGEAGVETQISSWKDPIKTAGATIDGTSAGYIPSAFVAAGRLQQTLGAAYISPPPRREKATALYDFMPQDTTTQLRVRKGDAMEIIRKDSDGWWFVVLNGDKGLVPGSYVKVDNPVAVGPDPAILSAREASNKRFNQWRQTTTTTQQQESANTQSVGGSDAQAAAVSANSPARVDARANDAVDDKPTVVRRLKKCRACNETILGRTKTAKGEIFHEICLICRGCRETIEEEDEFTIVKKKAYHTDCANEMVHCRACDKEILGRAYKVAGQSFHKLCMACEQCQKPFEENGAVLEGEMVVCIACIEERRRKEEEAKAAARAAEEARVAAAKAKEEARLAEQRAAEAREAERRDAQERETAERAAEEARAAEEQAAAAKAAEEKAAEAAKLAEETARLSQRESEKSGNVTAIGTGGSHGRNLQSSFLDTSNLDEFDLGAAGDRNTIERESDGTDLDFENDYGGSFMSLNGERDSLRLSQVIDFGAVDEFMGGRQNNGDRMSALSDLSNISENEDFFGGDTQNIGAASSGGGGAGKLSHSTTLEEEVEEGDQEEEEEDDDGEREMCGGCGLVLEGEAIGALAKYFHYECFKCGHCRKVIAEDDGYAEKDGQAFHQQCYQTRFSKRCCRCTKVLKGKVVKALDSLYHPDCFVCFQCKSSLSESFFEHDGQAVCAQCKHVAITKNAAPAPADVVALGVGTVGYHFAAQDDTQLTILPGQQVSILQKDDDGWWFVDLNGLRGYVPGSYLIEHPAAPRKTAATKSPPKQEEPKIDTAPAKVAGLCSECGTQNPGVARFCRSCGNGLMD